jgi:hypothetical protein
VLILRNGHEITFEAKVFFKDFKLELKSKSKPDLAGSKENLPGQIRDFSFFVITKRLALKSISRLKTKVEANVFFQKNISRLKFFLLKKL